MQLRIIATGAAKDNKKKILAILTEVKLVYSV